MADGEQAAIRELTGDHRRHADAILFGSSPPAEVSPDLADDQRVVLGAFRADQLVGFAGAQRLPGPTASWSGLVALVLQDRLVWLQLAERLIQRLEQSGVRLIQALAAIGDDLGVSILTDCGFRRAGTIRYYLAVPAHCRFDRCRHVAFSRLDRSQHQRLLRIVTATLQEALDSLPITEVLSVAQIIEGFTYTSGGWDDWYVVQRGGRDIGCVLMSNSKRASGHGIDELVYCGLVPSARGHGWGVELLAHAQQVSARRGHALMALADAANIPAIRSYERAGFAVCDERHLLVRTANDSARAVITAHR